MDREEVVAERVDVEPAMKSAVGSAFGQTSVMDIFDAYFYVEWFQE